MAYIRYSAWLVTAYWWTTIHTPSKNFQIVKTVWSIHNRKHLFSYFQFMPHFSWSTGVSYHIWYNFDLALFTAILDEGSCWWFVLKSVMEGWINIESPVCNYADAWPFYIKSSGQGFIYFMENKSRGREDKKGRHSKRTLPKGLSVCKTNK